MSSGLKFITIDNQKKGVRKFELDMFASIPTILIIAKRRSGKSWLCRDLLRYFKSVPAGIIIAKTEGKGDPFYAEFFPESYIYYNYSSNILKKIFKRQSKFIEKSKLKAKSGIIIDPRFILLMDDCLSDKGEWANDQLMLKLMFEGRHDKIIFILTMQTPLGIGTQLRGNFDYYFLLAEDQQRSIKNLYENYAGFVKNLNTFKTIFKQLTTDFHMMVVANVGANEDISKKIYWYKATGDKVGNFGCSQLKLLDKYNYNPDWNKDYND